MILLCERLPELDKMNAELLKIQCLYDAYKNDDKVLFWCQNKDDALISMADGNMIIFNNGANIEELSDFVEVLSPVCVYSDYETLAALNKKPKERINIMHRKADIKFDCESDRLSSKEIYELLDVEGLSLPDYPHFAVDYCHRLNNRGAQFFAIKDTCAAVSFNSGKKAIMNGIASHKKGFGSVALKGILNKNFGRDFLVCCRDAVKPFYQKNGFKTLYFGGYWIKNNLNEGK